MFCMTPVSNPLGCGGWGGGKTLGPEGKISTPSSLDTYPRSLRPQDCCQPSGPEEQRCSVNARGCCDDDCLGVSQTPPQALLLRGHDSTPLGAAGLPPPRPPALHKVTLSPLAFQSEASNPGCWEVPFHNLGNFQKILPFSLGPHTCLAAILETQTSRGAF